MAASSSLILSFIFFLLRFSLSHSFTFSLTPVLSLNDRAHTRTDPWQKINLLASSSLARAHHLKHPHPNSSSSDPPTKIPLSPQSYGGYSISLTFGSPPQTLSFVMDTGSSLVWFPCTHRYLCSDCAFSGSTPNTPSTTFIPKLSSSAKVLGCTNPKCRWVFGGSDAGGKCPADGGQICPPYMVRYGSGSTSGLLLSETLHFPGGGAVADSSDFVVGCSILSTRQPSGVAGFGRGKASLPTQMGLKGFSYCLVSHRFDNKPVSSELVLTTRGSENTAPRSVGAPMMMYTRFHKNPAASSHPAYEDYYYVSLRKITVGGRRVEIPYGFLTPGSDGNGGTIVDSGTTFTFMDPQVFDPVAREFEEQMSEYNRAADVETRSGLRPCFNISGQAPGSLKFPELVFHFKGGAKLELPIADYFSYFGDSNVLCMTIVSDTKDRSGGKIGPSIIIGNYQQQNVYMEYDLENDRLGFRNQICK